jgi:hypothetical protein
MTIQEKGEAVADLVNQIADAMRNWETKTGPQMLDALITVSVLNAQIRVVLFQITTNSEA